MSARKVWVCAVLPFVAVTLLSGTTWLMPVPATSAAQSWVFSGHVYQGTPPDTSTPFRAVEVTLYGSNDPGAWGTLLDQTLTNTSGAFSLSTEAQREYYHIVETQPAGYYSTGAQAGSGGTKVDNDWIRYKTPSQGSYAGNTFWDEPYATATPTRTSVPPTPTLTRTAIPPTATGTAIPTRTGTSLPPTETLIRTATPTSTRVTVTPLPTATGTPSPQPGADLTVYKQHIFGLPITPGKTSAYMLLVRHPGPAVAPNVVVTDTLPSELSFEGDVSGRCALVASRPPNDIVRCELGNLQPDQGAGTRVNISVRVDQEACGTIRNVAEVHSDAPDPNPADNVVFLDDDLGPCDEPDVSFTKTVLEPSSGVVYVGHAVRFRIEVRNNTTSTLMGFAVADQFLEADYDFMTGWPPPPLHGGNGTYGMLAWGNLTLRPGDALSFDLELVTQRPTASAENCAHLLVGSGTAGHPNPVKLHSVSCASVEVRPPEGKHFLVEKKLTIPSNHIASVGDKYEFWTWPTNTGTVTPTTVTCYDYMTKAGGPPQLQFICGSGYCPPGPCIQCGLGGIVTDTATPLLNTAVWTFDWPDGSKETKSASDYLFVVDGPVGQGLAVGKTLLGPPGSRAISDTVTFRVTVTNTTGSILTTVPLTDAFDAACLRFQESSPAPDEIARGTLVWHNIGPLPPGGSRTLDVHFHAEAVCPLAMDCAAARMDRESAAPLFGAACATVDISGSAPQLRVSKTRMAPSPVHPGDMVEWLIEVENTGTEPLSVVPLHDAYPTAYFDFGGAIPAPDTVDAAHGRLDWTNLGPLTPGQIRTVSVGLTVKKPGVSLQNCAESSYTVGSSTLIASDCDVVDVIAAGGGLQVQKVRLKPALGMAAAVGDTVVFSITVRNVGAVTLTNVIVDDQYAAPCLTFLDAPGMTTQQPSPGLLRWQLPALAPGEIRGWEVHFRAEQVCPAAGNSVVVTGQDPVGDPVHDGSPGADTPIEPPQPAIRVRKRLADPQALPMPGDILRFELRLENAGNITLESGPLEDNYDTNCLEYVASLPLADFVSGTGIVRWNNVGPLPPVAARAYSVFLRAKTTCWPSEDCAWAWMLDVNQAYVEDGECYELYTGMAQVGIYLPIILRQA